MCHHHHHTSSAMLTGFQLFLLTIITVDGGRNKGSSPAVVGGSPALPEEFPFMAALGWLNDAGQVSFHGGGMVISNTMVLTAAHCVYKNGKLPDMVYIGGTSLSEDARNGNSFAKFEVKNVTIHPKYVSNQGYDDIAILELTSSTFRINLSFNGKGPRFPPICLWTSDNLKSDQVTAIGYGLTEFAGWGSQELLKVQLTAFSSDFCAPFFKRQRKYKMGLSDAHICAGDKNGIKDTCQGDSGGPLMVRHNNEFFAVGITSSGQACSGLPPAIYTKIFPYTEWITEVLRERGEVLKSCTGSGGSRGVASRLGYADF